jgi:iron complex outermembrane receptor protein
VTVKAGFNFDRTNSTDTRTNAGPTRLKRGDTTAGANIVLPLTSRRDGVAGAIGDISLNFSGGINHLSDFGTLTDWSAGLTWSPTEKLTFQSSYIVNEAAPSLGQLGNPQIVTFNVPVFDFVRGDTALARIVTGGNPGLRAETQRDIKLSMNWELPVFQRSSLLVEYFSNSSDDVTHSFPLLTPAIEAAFPERVLRDATGRLIEIDRRPVTFDKVKNSRLRWGFNISGRIGEQPQHGGGGMRGGDPRPPGGPGPDPERREQMRSLLCNPDVEPDLSALPAPMQERLRGPDGSIDQTRLAALRERMCAAGPGATPAQSVGGGGGGGMFGRGRPRGGRWNLAIYHTVRFTDLVTIVRGGPVLDQLAGGDDLAGAVSRHSLELEGGFFYKGVGLRLNGNWESPARGAGLRFGSVTRLDARLFVNLGMQEKLVEKAPFLKGLRIALDVNNIFDSRQKVTDANGMVPLAYQKDFRDPRGRIVGIDIRKMF